MRTLLVALGVLLPLLGNAEPLAITFDDLPLNGQLAPGTTRVGITKDVLRILKKHRVAQTCGFINARKLEADADAAAALRLWVAGNQRVGNQAYSHMDLHKSTAESFMQDVAQNEPVLQLLAPSDDWRWFLEHGVCTLRGQAGRSGDCLVALQLPEYRGSISGRESRDGQDRVRIVKKPYQELTAMCGDS